MTILSAAQPAYMPWPGYFEKIALSDIHITLDTVQLERGSYTCRNQILSHGELKWLTIPIVHPGDLSTPIRNILIDDWQNWRRSHLDVIQNAYRDHPFFPVHFPTLRFEMHLNDHKWLHNFLWDNMTFWLKECQLLGERKFYRQSASCWTREQEPSKMLINFCKTYGADVYLSGPKGRDYLDLAAFEKDKIEVRYHEPDYKPLSILDWWFNSKEIPWEKMKESS